MRRACRADVREIPFRVVLGHFEIDLWKISMDRPDSEGSSWRNTRQVIQCVIDLQNYKPFCTPRLGNLN